MRLILLLLSIQFSYSNYQVKDFFVDYLSPSGTGEVSLFELNGDSYRDQSFGLSLVDGNIEIKADSEDVQIPKVPSFVKNLNQFRAKDFDLSLDENGKANVSLVGLEVQSHDYEILLSELLAQCGKDLKAKSIVARKSKIALILKSCIKNARATLSSLFYNSSTDSSFLNSSIDISKGSFILKSLIKYIVKGLVDIRGDISFDDSSEILTLKVESAKLGVLGIKKQVFKLLKSLQSNERIVVDVPYVYIATGENTSF